MTPFFEKNTIYSICKTKNKDIATRYRKIKNEIKTIVWVAEIDGILYNIQENRT